MAAISPPRQWSADVTIGRRTRDLKPSASEWDTGSDGVTWDATAVDSRTRRNE
jgi:hypothetical protein